MRPPIAAAKNDGVPSLHNKTQLNQKELLAENHINLNLSSYPQNHQTTSTFLTPDSDDYLYYSPPTAPSSAYSDSHFCNESSVILSPCEVHHCPPSSATSINTDLTIISTATDDYTAITHKPSSKVKRVTSDFCSPATKKVIKNPQEIKLPPNIDIRVSINRSNSLEQVPKNLFVNNFESSPIRLSVATLPLSETEPLLTNIESTVADPKRSICLNKHSASLIFTKKDVLSRSNDVSFPSQSSSNRSLDASTHLEQTVSSRNKKRDCGHFSSSGGESNEESVLVSHRRSLQLNYSSVNSDFCAASGIAFRHSTANSGRKQHAYSWYAPVYSALQEELEQESRGSSPIHNLANSQKKQSSPLDSRTVTVAAATSCSDTDNETFLETSNLLNSKKQLNIHDPQLHQPQSARIRRSLGQSTVVSVVYPVATAPVSGSPAQTEPLNSQTSQIVGQNEQDGGPQAGSLLGGPLPRRKRFENFLKSLVGRKPSNKDISISSASFIPPPVAAKISFSPSEDQSMFRRENSILGSVGGTDPHHKITNSTLSLNSVQQRLWNVVPLLKREGSCSSLLHEKPNSLVQYSPGLRKCETVLALSRSSSGLEPIRPLNRLRINSSTSTTNNINANCSRCSSLMSLAAMLSGGSRYSLNQGTSFAGASSTGAFLNTYGQDCVDNDAPISDLFTCKLCLGEVNMTSSTSIAQCNCRFCTECMTAYVEFEISEGAYEISCPDAQCPQQGIMALNEISELALPSSVKKHHRYRLNREIELDKTRTWCPRAGCETVCSVGIAGAASPSSSTSTGSSTSSTSATAILGNSVDKTHSITQVLCAVQCPTCKVEFCSGCKKPWHPNITCEENIRRLASEGQEDSIGIPFDNDLIKCCPMCAVPIEKDEGCAQMMCKRCKHVFCWYCLASLDDDFLLRHYDKGPCKNKLGHSRASVVWHRAQVIGIFAGFGILLLVASPLLLLAAPCIICCKCRICNGQPKVDDVDAADFDEMVGLQR